MLIKLKQSKLLQKWTFNFGYIALRAYICDTFQYGIMKYINLKLFITLLLFSATGIGVSAQIRIVTHTTAQSLAMTADIDASYEDFSYEIIEAYESVDVDEQPMFPGGNNALVQYINSSRRYPVEAYNRGIHGRVLCSFIVQPDGSITHINVLRGVEPSLDREAVRVLNSMPQWKAGRIEGIPVPVYCILPVVFRL